MSGGASKKRHGLIWFVVSFMLLVHRRSKKVEECLFCMPVARVLALFWLLALKQLSKRRRVLAALFWPFMSLFLPLLS